MLMTSSLYKPPMYCNPNLFLRKAKQIAKQIANIVHALKNVTALIILQMLMTSSLYKPPMYYNPNLFHNRILSWQIWNRVGNMQDRVD